jgi:gamma-glutamylcyclotransferase (GGCT)/AIG2-like uncharacterized protein YtfP
LAQRTKGGIRVFVYGTLKRQHPNHRLLESANIRDTMYLGRCRIVGNYRMLDLGNFPAVQRTTGLPPQAIYGEVYQISQPTLDGLDILEGNGSFYTREKVSTGYKNAWIYLLPPRDEYARRYPVIPSGVWHPTQAEQDFIARDVELETELPPALVS